MIDKIGENKKSVHIQLKDWLRAQVMNMATGDKLPSENMLCRKYELARMTVSKALNELEHEGIIYRKQGKGTFVSEPAATPVYFLIPYAGALQDNHAVENPLVGVYSGVLQEATERGMKVEVLVTSPTNQRKDIDWELFNLLRPGAKMLIYGFWFVKLFDFLKTKNFRVVFINPQWECEDIFADIISSWHNIIIDRQAAMNSVVKHLKDAGCRRLAFIHNIAHYMNPFMRGYEEALNREGLTFCRQLLIHCSDRSLDAYNVVTNMLYLREKYPFDAIIANSSNQMLGILQALNDNSIKIPEEIALFSLEDSSQIEHNTLPVSALDSDYYNIGRLAMKKFATHVYESGKEIVNCNIIKRVSTQTNKETQK
ncbi:MAG: GntR family transcriptional regulator [Victivallaceae bacterium]